MLTASVPAIVQDFGGLTRQVRAAGLFDRRLGRYWTRIVLTIATFGAAWVGFFAVGASWTTLAVAAVLGFLSTQIGFLGHDAGHRQIFGSLRANRLFGLAVGNGLIGLSFGWWVPKHNAHHAHPNQVDRDPDLEIGATASAPSHNCDIRRRRAWSPGRWQAELFFPLMLLRSTGLYVSGVHDLIRRHNRTATFESALLVGHAGLYLGAVFWVLPPIEAIAFVAVHQAVFSLYLGCSFAPNHKGMPILEEESDLGFARRQVITARNVTGGRFTGFLFGGLNYQIEHHLFPAMPRPNLARAQSFVRRFCIENGFGYCSESPIASYRHAMRQLRLAANPVLPSLDRSHLIP